MTDFPTIKLLTARILRDNPDLRGLNGREKVWFRIKQKHPTAKFSTVERCIRHLQNTMGLYLPVKEDNRFIKEKEYKEYFNNNNNNNI